MMTTEARVAAVKERVRARQQQKRRYHQFPGSLLGVCQNEKLQKKRRAPGSHRDATGTWEEEIT